MLANGMLDVTFADAVLIGVRMGAIF